MHLDVRQDNNCISQCPDVLPCNCSANQQCVRINRSCTACAENQCVDIDNSSATGGSGGVSKGALAGGIVGALAFFAIAVAVFLWYRRRNRLLRSLANPEVKKDIPAPAETVLNRPDPIEKPPSSPSELGTHQHYFSSSSLSPESHPLPPSSHHTSIRSSVQSNPFSDTHSIQTVGTEGTNVIPIALVSPDHAQSSRSSSLAEHSSTTASSAPVRPARSPDLNLNLEHVNVSHDTLKAPNYALSTISGVSGASSRNSYMSSASYSSDFLNEAPMIITPSKGAVRQVLGVVKAEVIKAPGTAAASSSSNDAGLKPPSYQAKPSVGSPLAATSFGPADVVKEVDESLETGDPFSDAHSSTGAEYGTSAPPTANSYVPDSSRQNRESAQTALTDLPWAQPTGDLNSRPSSMFTQAGSVIDIGSVTRVNVGLSNFSPGATTGTSRSQFRTTMGRLVTPPTGDSAATLQEQQQRALAHAQAQAQAQGLDKNRRTSGSSVISAASTRADSILESFPFVPPSPISDRPIRTPPVSPLGQQSFTAPPPTSPLSQHMFTVAPPSPLAQQGFKESARESSDITDDVSVLPPPPDRRTLGFSTASQLSTASSGLGSFPFQIDSGSSSDRPPSAFHGRQRASLDTLALTSDLSSYPLGFDRESMQPPKKG